MRPDTYTPCLLCATGREEVLAFRHDPGTTLGGGKGRPMWGKAEPEDGEKLRQGLWLGLAAEARCHSQECWEVGQELDAQNVPR